MARKITSLPSERELEILGDLWREGPSTVGAVYERLREGKVRYTTVLKQLQIMLEKELVDRDVLGRGHIYRAAVTVKDVRHLMIKRMQRWASYVGRFSGTELGGVLVRR